MPPTQLGGASAHVEPYEGQCSPTEGTNRVCNMLKVFSSRTCTAIICLCNGIRGSERSASLPMCLLEAAARWTCNAAQALGVQTLSKNPCGTLAITASQRMPPFTMEVQRWIWERQNPPVSSCGEQQFLLGYVLVCKP